MKDNWMKKFAVLLVCAILTMQMPVLPVMAEETNAPETSITRADTENTPEYFETQTDMENETDFSETQADTENELGPSETQTDTESRQEPLPEDAEDTDITDIEESTSTETDMETDTASESETETASEAQESGEGKTADRESRVRYILGREMTSEEIAEQKAMEPDYLPEMEIARLPDEAMRTSAYSSWRNSLPESYDSRDGGNLPSVRNQNPWGACWTFAFLGIMENSLIRQGYAAVENTDLSERHLAYFTYHTGYDALDNANDDTITSSPQNFYLKSGGNDNKAAIRLMNWQGAADETDYPYSTTLPDDLEQSMAQEHTVDLKTCYFYPAKSNDAETRETVKRLILEYECVSWSYYQGDSYYNYSTAAYYNNEIANTNHAIIVVGWDDKYAKENFKTSPQDDGAWIVRNSWGAGWGDKGYFYISYEDVSLGSGNPVCVADAEPAGSYDNNYFHSNSLGNGKWGKYKKVAQIYQAKSPHAVREKLMAVSFMAGSADTDYEIQIYKNPKKVEGIVQNPESGTAMLGESIKGTTSYAGVYTIALPEPVIFEADDDMAIVISFMDSAYMYCDSDYTMDTSDGNCTARNAVEAGESLYMLSSTWQDMSKGGRSLRINALTTDLPDVVTTPVLSVYEASEASDFEGAPTAELKWNKCSNAQGYEVYRSSDGQAYEKIADIVPELRTYTSALPVREEGTYYYKVRAIYQNGFEESNIVRHHFEGRIAGPQLEITHDGNTAAFSWKPIKGADSYELQKKEAEGYETIKIISAADEQKYTLDISDFALGAYHYRIKAVKGTEDSQWSEAVLTKDLTVSQQNCQAVELAWLPVEGAQKYKVRILVGSTWYIYTVTDSQYLLDFSGRTYEVKVGEDYKYRMMAYDAAETAIYTSSTVAFRLTPEKLEAVSAAYNGSADNVGPGTVTLQWSGGRGAANIDIYRSMTPQDMGERIALSDVEAETYTDVSELEYGKTYFYRLEPWMENQAGEKVSGAVSEAVEVRMPPASTALSPVLYQDEAVILHWTPVLGAEGYLIEKSINSEAFVQIADVEGVDTVSYTDAMVSRCNQYCYRVTAYNTDTDGNLLLGPVSDMEEIVLLPEPISITGITERKGTMLEIILPAVEHAQGYMLYRAQTDGEENSGNFTLVAADMNDTIYIDKDVSPDTTYYYKALVTINGLTSSLADTQAVRAVTKPILQELTITLSDSEMLKGSSQELLLSAVPSHYPYADEIIWSAADEKGAALEVNCINGDMAVTGDDGKEILRIADNTIIAVGESENKTVYLFAAIEEVTAECRISVYHDGFWIAGVSSQIYTGSAITPKVRVYDRNRQLTEGVDYSVSYKNNINVNDASNPLKAPTITVTGKGNYSGKETAVFKILQKDISGQEFLADDMFCAYNKKVQKPIPAIAWNGVKLKKGRDFEIEYIDTAKGAYQEPGSYTILIKGNNNFRGTREVSVTVTQGVLMSKTKTARIPKQTYTGNAIEPDFTVKSGNVTLIKNQDYTVQYVNNIEIGTATAVITGNGIDYFGIKRVTFPIAGDSIKKAVVTGLEKSFVYTGAEIKPTGYVLTIKTAQGSRTLLEGEDYETACINNIHAGAASIVFTGKGGFTGTLKKTFKITPYDINSDTQNCMTFEMDAKIPYAKGGCKPQPTVVFKMLQGEQAAALSLEQGKDYKLAYRNHTTTKSGAKSPVVVITGIGDFQGKKSLEFAIFPQDIGNLDLFASDRVYTGKADTYKTTVSVVDLDGKKLKAGKDYAKVLAYTYAEQTTLADGTVREEGEGVTAQDQIPCGTVLCVTVTGLQNYSGSISGQYRITRYDIGKAKVTVKGQIYTGNEIEPGKNDSGNNDNNEILVKYKGKELKYGEDYIIAGYADNIKKGSGRVIIEGIGDYGGTKTAAFAIRSKLVLWWNRE